MDQVKGQGSSIQGYSPIVRFSELTVCALLLLTAVADCALAQQPASATKRFDFKNSNNKSVYVSEGDTVILRLKRPEVEFTCELLSISDTALVVRPANHELQQVIFISNIREVRIPPHNPRMLTVRDTERGKTFQLRSGRKVKYKLRNSPRFESGRILGCTDSTLIFSRGETREIRSVFIKDVVLIKIPNQVGARVLGGFLVVAGFLGTALFDIGGPEEGKIFTVGMMIGGMILMVGTKRIALEKPPRPKQ